MPTLRLPTLAGVSIHATGNSSVSSDRRGTLVSYTGHLVLNGRAVYSPRQVLAKWSDEGQEAIRTADRTEHTDPQAHWWARGVVTGYGIAVELFTAYFDTFGPQGLPLTDLVAGIKVARAAAFEQAPADMDDNQRLTLTAATSTLLTLANELAVTASYTWEVQ